MRLLYLYLILTSVALAQISEADFTTFRDSEYGFSLRYPQSWLPVEPSHAQTRFKAVSDHGRGSADVSINVGPNANVKNRPPEAYFESTKKNPEALVAALRRQVPTARLLSHGETTIANLPAYYIIVGFTQSGGNMQIPIVMIQYIFGRNSLSHTLTMRSYQEDWSKHKQIFDYIAFSFVYSQLPIK